MVCFKAREHFESSVSFFCVQSTRYCDLNFYPLGKIWYSFVQLCKRGPRKNIKSTDFAFFRCMPACQTCDFFQKMSFLTFSEAVCT